MKRDKLISIIEKYYLGGLTEQVRFKINDGKLLINFTTHLKDCIGQVESDFDLEDSELGIYDTTQFYKLIKVIKDPISINIIRKGDKCMKLDISDSKFDLSYNLGDLGLISEGKLSGTLPEPVVSLDLDAEFIDKFIKSHNALEKAEMFQLKTEIDKQKVPTVKFVIGLTDKFSNKISFSEPTKEYETLPNFTYKVNNFREILSNNKLSKLSMYVYNMGIVRIDSVEDDLKIKYFIVPNK